NRRARLSSLLHGGGQENGWRAGIENVPAIVGAGVAAEIALREGAKWSVHSRKLQERLWNGIKKSVPYVRLNGPEPGLKRIATNLNISTEFIDGESQVLLFDTHGIAVAGSTNCVTKALRVSPVLKAIGLPDALAQGTIILSLGKDNSDSD